MSPQTVKFPVDFVLIRKTIANEIQKVTGLIAVREEAIIAEKTERPKLPYFGFKITTPAAKSGDDSKQNVLDGNGNPTTKWNSGGVRQMSVSFDCYATSQEEAYNYMGLWQTALDLENIQEDLRRVGIAVWIIGTVADLSQLLNTGYEGRAHMDCQFGIAMNLVSDLGEMDTVTVNGAVTTEEGVENITQTAP